jgi:hypothetical protein
MQWIIHDEWTDSIIGPFPTQDQAMTYAEQRLGKLPWTVRPLTTPAFMPEVIHG